MGLWRARGKAGNGKVQGTKKLGEKCLQVSLFISPRHTHPSPFPSSKETSAEMLEDLRLSKVEIKRPGTEHSWLGMII